MKPKLLQWAVPTLVLLALITGCATTSPTAHTESLLAASGFKVVPATTPQQLQLVQTLAPGKVTRVKREGKDYYVFADSTQKQLYVGQAEQYQSYLTRLEIERNAAADNRAMQESLQESRTDDSLNWNSAWGTWTGN